MKVTFGHWLKQQRKARKLSQDDLAKRVGASKSTISLYENDHIQQPRFTHLDGIGKAFGLKPGHVREKFMHLNGLANDSHSETIEFPEIGLFAFQKDMAQEHKDRFKLALRVAVDQAKAMIEAESGNTLED